MSLTNRVYNGLKFVALVFLPALGSAYFSLAQVAHLPNPETVVGVITVVDTFLGVLLKASTSQYNKTVDQPAEPDGDLVIGEVDGEHFSALQGSADGLAKMATKSQVTLNVVVKRPQTLADLPPQ